MKRRPSRITMTDLFAGAGGSSLGGEAAGASLVMAVNHWPRAIETHATNFTEAGHDCRNISDTHPRRYPHTDILWASPECTTWSQARGKRRNFTGQRSLDGFEEEGELADEAEERSRATMWDVIRFAEFHDYHAIVVENVVDIWGWSLMSVWFEAMHKLGYTHRVCWLNSQFFGVPQSRDRIYIVFWKTGNHAPDLDFKPAAFCMTCQRDVQATQSFKRPESPWGRYRTQYVYRCPHCADEVYPWVVPAAAAINWALPSERIGDRRKKLAAATMARIQAGIDRYWRTPLVMDTMRDPKFRDPATASLPTQTGRQSLALLTQMRGVGPRPDCTHQVSEPMGAVTAGGNHHGLLETDPLYVKMFGNVGGHPARHTHPTADTPLGTVTADDHHALLQGPLTVQFNSNAGGDPARRTRPADTSPLGTVTADPRYGVLQAAPLYIKGYGPPEKAGPMSAPVCEKPLGAVTAQDHHGLLHHPGFVAVGAGNTFERPGYARIRDAQSEPFYTQSATNTMGVAEPPEALVVSNRTHCQPRPADGAALPTQATATTSALLEAPRAFVSSYYRTVQNAAVADPMGTVTATDRHALVEGPEIAIDDCRFRMLEPAEIQLGMDFPGAYIITGNKREAVRQLGQGVTPPVAQWLVSRIVESLR